jgi:hypothetical protein
MLRRCLPRWSQLVDQACDVGLERIVVSHLEPELGAPAPARRAILTPDGPYTELALVKPQMFGQERRVRS